MIEGENSAYGHVKSYLEALGFEEKQSEIFLKTYQYGPKPASTIASLCGTERSYCYKVLEQFVGQGLLESTSVGGVKNYYVANPDVLLQKLDAETAHIQSLKDQYKDMRDEFFALKKVSVGYIPKVQQFLGIEGIKQRYDDMVSAIELQNLLVIQTTITTTFTSQVTKYSDLQVFYDTLIRYIEDRKIVVKGKIGTGSLIIESMQSIVGPDQLKTISVGNQSIQLWVIGEITYIGLFREMPVGLKIHSLDMADLLQTIITFIQ